MPSVSDWKVPASAQPKPEDYSYDLEHAFASDGRGARGDPRGCLHGGNARHRTRRQRRIGSRQGPGSDHRLSDHRSRNDLAQSQRRPLGAGARPGLRPGTQPVSRRRQARHAHARVSAISAATIGVSASASLGRRRRRPAAAAIVAQQEFAGTARMRSTKPIPTAPAHPQRAVPR